MSISRSGSPQLFMAVLLATVLHILQIFVQIFVDETIRIYLELLPRRRVVDQIDSQSWMSFDELRVVNQARIFPATAGRARDAARDTPAS